MPETIIIIPCYNEAARLKLDKYREFLGGKDEAMLLFVNDGSTDNTAGILQQLKNDFPGRVDFTSYDKNKGKAGAIKTGISYASAHYQADYLGFFDADLSTPLPEIASFISLFKGHPHLEMVFGSRVKRMGATIKRNLSRHIMGRVFASLVSDVLQIPVYDSQCGAKVFRSHVAVALFDEPFISRWIFDVELIARFILLSGYSKSLTAIYEYPLPMWSDDGNSRITFRDLLIMPYELAKISRKYYRKIKVLRRTEIQ